MTTRVEDINLTSSFEPIREVQKGVLEYQSKTRKVLARVKGLGIFDLSFDIGTQRFNTGSLARYICEKYVSGENPLQHKSLIRKTINEVLKQPNKPKSLDELVERVLKTLAGPEVSRILDLGASPKVEKKSDYDAISELFRNVQEKTQPASSASKPTVQPISDKLNAQRSIDSIRERTIGAADRLLKNEIFPKLGDIELPEPLARIAERVPSFDAYVQFVQTLRQLTGKTADEIPDTLQNWKVVLDEAMLLGKSYEGTFSACADARERFEQLESEEHEKGKADIQVFNEAMAQARATPTEYPLSRLQQTLSEFQATVIRLEEEQGQRKKAEAARKAHEEEEAAKKRAAAKPTEEKKEEQVAAGEEKKPAPPIPVGQEGTKEVLEELSKLFNSAKDKNAFYINSQKTQLKNQEVSQERLQIPLLVRAEDQRQRAIQAKDQGEQARLDEVVKDPERRYQTGIENLARVFLHIDEVTLERAIPREKLEALLSKSVTIETILSLIFEPPFSMETCLAKIQQDTDAVTEALKGSIQDPEKIKAQIAKIALERSAITFLVEILTGTFGTRH